MTAAKPQECRLIFISNSALVPAIPTMSFFRTANISYSIKTAVALFGISVALTRSDELFRQEKTRTERKHLCLLINRFVELRLWVRE